MEIRVAGLADAGVVGKVHSEAWKSAYRGVFPDSFINLDTAAKRTEEFLDSIKDDKYIYYLLQESDQTAGIVKTGVENNALEIESFYILNEYRGKGFGSQFIDFIKNSLKPECIRLWVLEDNTRARHFYENNGFVMTGESRMINRGTELKQMMLQFTPYRLAGVV